MFGDIIKVTPTSKTVGDLALLMITSGLTPSRCSIRKPRSPFPSPWCSSSGDIGQPLGGFPAQLQRKILKGATPLTERPGAIDARGGS